MEEVARCVLHTDSCALANGLDEWSRPWKEHGWEIGDRKFGEEDYVDSSLWKKKCEGVCVLHDYTSNSDLSRGSFNNQVERGSIYGCQSASFPHHPCHHPEVS